MINVELAEKHNAEAQAEGPAAVTDDAEKAEQKYYKKLSSIYGSDMRKHSTRRS